MSDGRPTRNLLLVWLTIVCVIVGGLAILAKLWLTRGALMPGLDGAYYWVQVRAILARGELAYEDLPAIFWLQAGIAQLIGDIPLAVRITDAVLPALSVIPLAVLAKNARPRWMVALVLVAVLLNPVQLFFFTGDFIKNESTVPLVFLLGLLLSRWQANRRWAFGIAIGTTLVLISLCHFGALLLGLSITVLWVTLKTGRRSLKFWLITCSSVLASIGLTLVLLGALVPDRFARLVGLVGDPGLLFESPIALNIRNYYYRPAILFAVLAGQVFSIVFAIILWRVRTQLTSTVRAAVTAFVVVGFLSSSPLIGVAWADRLIAMSFVPLWLAGILLWTTAGSRSIRIATFTLSATTLLATLVVSPFGANPRLLDDTRFNEFVAASKSVVLDRPSLIVATHGLDYLVAWQFETDVSDERFFRLSEEGKDYSGVYRLYREYEKPTGDIVFTNDYFVITRLK